MRDIQRIDPIIELLRKFWKKYPDLRLTQILPILGEFYTEDDIVKQKLENLLCAENEEELKKIIE